MYPIRVCRDPVVVVPPAFVPTAVHGPPTALFSAYAPTATISSALYEYAAFRPMAIFEAQSPVARAIALEPIITLLYAP
ncbi:hypothetical protein D3C76_1022280 [compost metagenome]